MIVFLLNLSNYWLGFSFLRQYVDSVEIESPGSASGSGAGSDVRQSFGGAVWWSLLHWTAQGEWEFLHWLHFKEPRTLPCTLVHDFLFRLKKDINSIVLCFSLIIFSSICRRCRKSSGKLCPPWSKLSFLVIHDQIAWFVSLILNSYNYSAIYYRVSSFHQLIHWYYVLFLIRVIYECFISSFI